MVGYFYALLAAMCNSSIGIISRLGLRQLDFYQIAFFKCLFAFIILSALCVSKPHLREQVKVLKDKKLKLAFLAFWGIFLLYFFETKAFSIAPIPTVSFTVYSSGIVTIFLSYFLLKEKITAKKMMGMTVVASGGLLIAGELPSKEYLQGIIYALIGGIGYSVFLVMARKYNLKTSFGFLWWLMGFGCLFLLCPLPFCDITLKFPWTGFIYLIPLAILPTIAGFYFTSKALNIAEASKVQVLEMSDPLFTVLLAFIVFGEFLSPLATCGGGLILLGLMLIA